MVQDGCEMTKMFTGHKVGPEMQYEIMELLEDNKCQTRKEDANRSSDPRPETEETRRQAMEERQGPPSLAVGYKHSE